MSRSRRAGKAMSRHATRWLRQRETHSAARMHPELAFELALQALGPHRGPFYADMPLLRSRRPPCLISNEYRTLLTPSCLSMDVDGAPFKIAKYAFFRKSVVWEVRYEINLFLCLGEDGRIALLLAYDRPGFMRELDELRWFILPSAPGFVMCTRAGETTAAELSELVSAGVRLRRALANCPSAVSVLEGKEHDWSIEKRRDFLLEFVEPARELWNRVMPDLHINEGQIIYSDFMTFVGEPSIPIS